MMKKANFLGILMLVGILVCAANLSAEPQRYLKTEGSSQGLAISKEAKQEAIEARADRLLLYQDEVGFFDLDRQAQLQAPQEDNMTDATAETDSLPGVSGTEPDINPGGPSCMEGECVKLRQFNPEGE